MILQPGYIPLLNLFLHIKLLKPFIYSIEGLWVGGFLDRQKNWSEGKTTRGFPPEKISRIFCRETLRSFILTLRRFSYFCLHVSSCLIILNVHYFTNLSYMRS